MFNPLKLTLMIFAFLRKSPFYDRALAGEEYGMFNGYVAFSEPLPPSWTVTWDEDVECIDNFVNPHGGITFDRIVKPDIDMIPLTAIPDPEEWKDGIRCIGFDTAHLDDNAKMWNYETTKAETLELMEDVKRLIESRKA